MLNVYSKIGRAIEERFSDNWALTNVQYLNTRLDSNSLNKYIALSILGVDADQNTLGLTVSKGEVSNYILVVQIFVKKALGSGEMEEIADTLVNLLNRKTLILLVPGSSERGRVQFEVPQPPSPVNTDREAWFQWNMNFPFRVSI